MRRATILAGLGAAPALLAGNMTNGLAATPKTLQQFQAAEAVGQAHLKIFDDLDFNVFSNQEWGRLHESHSHDVVVHWPDGHIAVGLDRHIADLKVLFVYAPDTRIKVHPVKVEMGEWTSVIGLMEGTFTKPMPTAGGSTIAPTGKAFKLPMCTVGHWSHGVMDQEYLFWDGATYAKQMGLT